MPTLRQAIVHPACGKAWTGLRRAHCPACCRTFNRDSLADRHRKGPPGPQRHCADPQTLGMVERGGIWYGPPGDTPWANKSAATEGEPK